jgi:hypothetical protein
MSSWIKVRTIIGTDPAIAQIAARLKMEPAHVIGCFVLLWSWADGLTENGEIKNASRDLIDKISEQKGFAKEAEKVGWLQIKRTSVVFPKWDRHNSCSAKSRAGEATRKQEQRKAKKNADAQSEQPSSNSGQMSGHLSGQSSGPEERRGEERRGEKNTHPQTPEPGGGAASSNPIPDREAERTLPESLAQFPGMRELWRDWVAYCVERNHGKHPPTQTFDAHLKTLIACADRGGWPAVEDGVRRAVEMNFRAPLASEKNAYGSSGAADTNTNYANPPVPGLDPFNIPGDINHHLAQRDLLAQQNSGISTATTA